jgi:hypothetical protein
MADSNERRKHPVFAGEALLGWIWVWEPPALIDQEYAHGIFEPGPDFEPHRERWEEVMEMVRLLDAWDSDDKAAEDALFLQMCERQDEILDLGITVGEDRYPVEMLAILPGWSLQLFPPSDGFGSLAIDPAKVTREIWNRSPVPSHLAGWVGPAEVKDDRVTATVRCPCDCERMEFHFTGIFETPGGAVVPKTVEVGGVWFFLVKAVCERCRREHVLFDNLCHGHDGFLYHNPETAALPRPPLHLLRCPKCGATAHQGKVTIISDFKDRYFLEGYARQCGLEHWPDAYGCFAMGVTCCNCGHSTPGWIDYEAR